jgi:glutamate-1-semialdehyde 2,1-aminomutase
MQFLAFWQDLAGRAPFDLVRPMSKPQKFDTLDQALASAIENYAAKRPRTAAMHEKARAVMPGGNTRSILFSQPFPIRIEKSEGCRITDVDGHTYVDYVGEYSAGIYGHSNPKIMAAVNAALAMGINIGAHHAREIAFAEAVTKRFNLERVRFTNSGTEANMMALALARNVTGKPAIMPMLGGYHGGTLMFSNGASAVNAPFECVLGAYNDVAKTQALIREHADKLAAVIVEPMLGAGGGIAASPEFLAMLRAECSAHGILFVLDEVMTSRLAPGGLSEAWSLSPDLKTLGKYVGGGMSFGAFGGRADFMDMFDPSRQGALYHAGTFNNNTLTMTAGHVGLTEVYTPEAARALSATGEKLKVRLNHMFMQHQARLQVLGVGSLMAVHPVPSEIARPEQLVEADMRVRRLLYFHLLEDGIYLAERGSMALSLALGEAEHDAFTASLERFVSRYRAFV